MIPWVQLGTARVPQEGGELRLMQRGSEYSIMAGAVELMNSRLSGSEEALASLAWARIEGRRSPKVLIGGLGMGFTLRAALAVLPAEAEVIVAELLPTVAAWARGPLAELFDGSLDDPRVRLHEGDVADLIAGRRQAYDAILLDVDNGPEALTRKANDRLYDLAGLALARAALTPGGVLAVWSSAPNARFSQRLRAAHFDVTEVPVRARRSGRGGRHHIWLALRSEG